MRCLLRKAPKLLETVIPTQGGFGSKVCEARTALPGTRLFIHPQPSTVGKGD